MVLINKEDRITRSGATSKSVLNLARLTKGHVGEMTWEIREEDKVGSNQAVICISVLKGQQGYITATVRRLAFRKADWEVVQMGVAEVKKVAEGEWRKARREKNLDKMGELLERSHKQAITRVCLKIACIGDPRGGWTRR